MDTLEIAKELISRPSVTPDDGGCQAFISQKLKTLGFVCESLKFQNVENLWARFGTQKPLFVFAGHTDVVPPGPLDQWTSPPFEPQIRDGFLFGRGASDMKVGIAAMISATEKFLQLQKNLPGSIAFLLTSDEEGPAKNGTKRVIEELQNRKISIDYCLVGEPSSNVTVGDQIRIGRRGSLQGLLTVIGKQGHIANPQHALNPIHLCAQAITELVRTKWDEGNEHYPPTSFQFSNIHGGAGVRNIIPGHVELTFNFRHSTVNTVQQIKSRVELILADLGLEFKIDWETGAQPFLTSHGKLLTSAQQAIEQICKQQTLLSTGGGTSDGRFIAPTGAEVIELGVSNATAHHINECVKLEDIQKLSDIYLQLLKNIFQSIH